MATQNLVSAVITPETKTEILDKLGEIRGLLGFLLSLKNRDIQSLMKAGNSYMPFVDKAYAAVTEHPGIMSAVFSMEEFKRDYQLSKDLSTIVGQINQLAESLSNTLLAVNSDAMTASLEVYASVKQNTERVPGLKVVAAEMAEFFKHHKRKTAP